MGAFVLLVSALMAQTAQAAAPPSAPAETMRIQVAVRGPRGGGASGQFSSGESATIWIDPVGCGWGAATGVTPQTPPNAIVWDASGRIVSVTAEAYSVELTLKKHDSAAREQTTKFAVKRGESVVLDEVPSANCGGRSISLEASVVPAPAGASKGGARSASPPPVAAAGSSSGDGIVVNFTPAQFIDHEFEHLSDRATEMSYFASTGQVSDASVLVLLHSVQSSYRAELWLVYTMPDGTRRTFTTSGHIDEGGGTCRFAPLSIPLASPTLAFIAANLRPMATADGKLVLRTVIARAVEGLSQGASSRAVPMPKPGDVVSFELPQGPAALDGHRFELRVRLTPAG